MTETRRKVRASLTVLGLALSLGTSGTVFSTAEAADPTRVAYLPSAAGASGTLPSYGSDRPSGAAAVYHTVAEGETIWDIAKQHGVTIEDIKAANGIPEDQVIQVGQVLKVPAPPAESAPYQSAPEVAAIAPVPTVDALEPVGEPESLTPLPSRGEPSEEPANLAAFLEAQRLAETSTAMQSESASPSVESRTVRPNRQMDAIAVLPESTDPIPDADIPAAPAPAALPTKEVAKSRPEVDGLPIAATGDSVIHRVNEGETVWSIARAYGLETEALRQANDIADPDFILPGEQLVIPGEALAKDESEATKANGIDVSAQASESTEPSSARAHTLEPVQAAGPVSAATGGVTTDAVAAEVTTASALVGQVTREAADPYMASLLSEVAAVSQSRRVEDTLTAEQTATEAADSANEALRAALEDVEAVNPEFAPATDADSPSEASPALSSEELLAAAPLGSEVYAPVIEDPTGRVVSPDMPVLPGQEEYLPEAPNRFSGYAWPAQGTLTSGYGWRWGRMHRGIDIAGPVGTPIFAAAPGVVVRSGWNSGGYGNMVDIRHPDGSLTRYAHNSRLMVQEGQQVRQGQQIAEMGSTGYSTGPHLHFEIHIPEQGTVNPVAHLPGR